MRYKVCSLFSGSSGNATYIGTDDTHILIDSGKSGKRVIEALRNVGVNYSDLDCILITHEHSDHISSASVLSHKLDRPIFANEGTWSAMEKSMERVSSNNRRLFDAGKTFCIKDFAVTPFMISHDAASPVGFAIQCGNKKVSIATDLGYVSPEIINSVKDSDLVILEANHDKDMLIKGSYPQYLKRRIAGKKGHLSNVEAGEALVEMVNGRVTHAILAHLSKENNLPSLASRTVKDILVKNGVTPEKDIMIELASRDATGNMYFFD